MPIIKRMNIKLIRQIPIVDFLLAIGIYPVKVTSCYAWYYAPYREDEDLSFKVNKNRNIWYDFATAKSGDIIDLAVLVYRTHNIPKILKMIEQAAPAAPLRIRTFVPHPQQSAPDRTQLKATVFQNLRLELLESLPLLSYLSKRGINMEIASQECWEAHYTCHGNSYYAIAFPNEAGGYEIRNPYYKGCIAPKAVSFISQGQTDCVCLFEGFMDYLSFLTLRKRERLSVPCYGADLLVLNLANNLPKALSRLKAYKHIYCYLDNDDAGRRVVDMLREIKGDAVHDMMETYPLYKDLNDILVGKKKMP